MVYGARAVIFIDAIEILHGVCVAEVYYSNPNLIFHHVEQDDGLLQKCAIYF